MACNQNLLYVTIVAVTLVVLVVTGVLNIVAGVGYNGKNNTPLSLVFKICMITTASMCVPFP